jgi:hypothetical protein
MANGVNIPPNLYSGGAVVFDSRPSTNLAIQLMLKKQAREEALDEYEKNRINRINEQGLRDVDREGLDRAVMDLRGYYQGNKERIRKGNTAEAYEYEKKFRDVLGYISESKQEAAKDETFSKLRQERLKYGRSTPEDWFVDYEASQRPIRSEGFKSLDLTKMMSQQAPKYDPGKTMKLFSDIKRTTGAPRYEKIADQPFKLREITEERFDENAKAIIAAKAADLYDTDDGFAYEVQQDFNNPVKRAQLEKVFLDEFKTQPQSLSDYAIAKKMQEIQPVITKSKIIDDWQAKTDYMQKYKERNIALMNNLRGFSLSRTKTPLDLTTYQTATDGSKLITDKLQGFDVTSEPVSGESFGSDLVYYNPETGRFVYNDVLKNGAVEKSAERFVQDISALNPQKDITDILRLPYKNSTIGEHLLGEQDKKKKATTQTKKTTYTYQGYQYTEDEIAAQAKKEGMSIDEYIKKAGIKKN